MGIGLGHNNNNGYLDHGDIAAMNEATTLSVAFWIWGGVGNLLGKIEKSSVVFFRHNVGTIYAVHDSSAGWNLYTQENCILYGVWTHFALVYDGGNPATSRMTVYRDAVSQPLFASNLITPQGDNAGCTAPTALPDMSSNPLKSGDLNCTGVVAHMRLWNAALTQGDIAQEMSRYWAFRQADLLADCPYDDALWARDYSGHDNHGTYLVGIPGQTEGPPICYGGKVLVAA